MRIRCWNPRLSVLVVCAMGCSELMPEAGIVRDSMGVRIVEHGELGGRAVWDLEGPIYEVGPTSGPMSWGRIQDGKILPGGRAAVGDVLASHVVILGRTGEVEATLGRAGEGPGEFRFVRSIFSLPDDTLIVLDQRLARSTVFHKGTLLRTDRLDPTVLHEIEPIDLESSVVLVFHTGGWWPYVDGPWVAGVLGRYMMDVGVLDSLVTYDFTPALREGVTPNPFRPWGAAGATRDAFLTIRGDRPQFERFDRDGQLEQLVRWSESAPPLTESHWEEYLAVRWGTLDPMVSRPEDMEAELARSKAAAQGPLPISGGVRGDDEGNAWVAEYSPDPRHSERYRVFSPTGRFVGWVQLPNRFEVLDIAQGLVLGVHRDALDEETVAMYRLQR